MALNFKASKTERDLIEKIAERADAEIFERGLVQSRMVTMMDVTVVNNACPLDLARLLEADAYEFAHDVTGIRRHLNRKTGELEGCFLPRFARGQ